MSAKSVGLQYRPPESPLPYGRGSASDVLRHRDPWSLADQEPQEPEVAVRLRMCFRTATVNALSILAPRERLLGVNG